MTEAGHAQGEGPIAQGVRRRAGEAGFQAVRATMVAQRATLQAQVQLLHAIWQQRLCRVPPIHHLPSRAVLVWMLRCWHGQDAGGVLTCPPQSSLTSTRCIFPFELFPGTDSLSPWPAAQVADLHRLVQQQELLTAQAAAAGAAQQQASMLKGGKLESAGGGDPGPCW